MSDKVASEEEAPSETPQDAPSTATSRVESIRKEVSEVLVEPAMNAYLSILGNVENDPTNACRAADKVMEIAGVLGKGAVNPGGSHQTGFSLSATGSPDLVARALDGLRILAQGNEEDFGGKDERRETLGERDGVSWAEVEEEDNDGGGFDGYPPVDSVYGEEAVEGEENTEGMTPPPPPPPPSSSSQAPPEEEFWEDASPDASPNEGLDTQ